MLAKLHPVFRYFSTKKSTIDHKQMEYFNEIASVWWDEKGVLKILHEMNDLRITWIENSLRETAMIKTNANEKKPFEGLSILEVGCGGGILTEPLSKLGGNITGIDPNTKLINIAKERAATFNLSSLKYYNSTVEDHVLNNSGKYDVVICVETIEHVKEQDFFARLCVQCLKPGGSIFITTNSKSWPSKFVFITLLEDILNFFPSGTHQYSMFIDMKDVIRILEEENCKVVFTGGMIYNIFKSKWIMVKNPQILNYLVHGVKLS